MACSMGSERAMAICSSISLELDKDIIYVKRVKMNWYESDLSSNHWGSFGIFLNFLELKRLKIASFSIQTTSFEFKLKM
jgi:hypothetical protein